MNNKSAALRSCAFIIQLHLALIPSGAVVLRRVEGKLLRAGDLTLEGCGCRVLVRIQPQVHHLVYTHKTQ